MTEDEQDQAMNEFLAMVGRYVIVFQWIESKMEECLLLWWGHENWAQSKDRLLNMTNKQKVDTLWKEFRENPANERGRSRPDWVKQFEKLVERLHLERKRRNKLLHSHYLFDFLPIGQPVMQIDPKEGNRYLGKEAQDDIHGAVRDLAIDLSFAHTQVIHDYR
ncbi:hypothetical protein CO657_16365 [Rhizobium acidisoli]|uniref:Uncharacterized protein n=1 Tax=Rhizobium acidisoli TaxID=1538158 RepID=A0AAE5TY16_9HYPH|nr:hypothetical protein [Rhizobium acidisoli]QAS79537.1 hypothetical protein CO657_16365 [Rhizobium acidisoli]